MRRLGTLSKNRMSSSIAMILQARVLNRREAPLS
jgi:hypothetical protein